MRTLQLVRPNVFQNLVGDSFRPHGVPPAARISSQNGLNIVRVDQIDERRAPHGFLEDWAKLAKLDDGILCQQVGFVPP